MLHVEPEHICREPPSVAFGLRLPENFLLPTVDWWTNIIIRIVLLLRPRSPALFILETQLNITKCKQKRGPEPRLHSEIRQRELAPQRRYPVIMHLRRVDALGEILLYFIKSINSRTYIEFLRLNHCPPPDGVAPGWKVLGIEFSI